MTQCEPRENLGEVPDHRLNELMPLDTHHCWKGPLLPTLATQTSYLPCSGSGARCTPPGQGSTGSRARAGAPCCQKGTMLHPLYHTLAHHLLCLPIRSRFLPSLCSATPQALPGANSALYDSMLYNGMAHGICQSGCKQQRSFYHSYSVPVSTDGVFCN